MYDATKDVEYLRNRIVLLTDELHRINRALQQIQEGIPMTEAFDAELYLEAKEQQRSARSFLETIMLHLLKLKYCTNNRNHNEWRLTVTTKQYELRQKTEWNYSNFDKNDCIIFLKENFEKSYMNAIKEYNELLDEYSDLKDNVLYIPNNCPWSLDELISGKISSLMNKLPDPDELTVQMQLYPDICKYLDARKLSEKIIGFNCSSCKNYPDCISKYYEMKYGG